MVLALNTASACRKNSRVQQQSLMPRPGLETWTWLRWKLALGGSMANFRAWSRSSGALFYPPALHSKNAALSPHWNEGSSTNSCQGLAANSRANYNQHSDWEVGTMILSLQKAEARRNRAYC